MSTLSQSSMSPKKTFSALISFLLPLLIFLIPTNELFTSKMRLFFVITVIGVLCWAFDTLPQAVPAILMPIAFLLFQLAPGEVIFNVWSNYIPWMMIGGLVLANVMQSTGLMMRIAYRCITLTGGTYLGILFGLALTGIVGNILAPGKMAIPMAALTYGICMALDFGKSKASAGIMLGGAVSALLPQQFIYNPVNLSLTVGVGEPVTGPINVSWLSYFIYNIPSVLYLFIVLFLIARLCEPKDIKIDKQYFIQKYESLGQWQPAEIKTLLVCIALFVTLIIGSFKNWPIGWAFAIFPCLFFFPGIRAGKPEDIRNLDFSFVLFITACLSIGNVAGALGVGKLIASTATPLLSGQSLFVTFGLIWLIIVLSNFVLTPLAIISVLSLPMAQIATELGINPLCVYYFMCNAYDIVFLPYEYALYLIFFSFGLIRVKHFVQVMSLKAIVSIIFLLLIQLPYWMLTGMMWA